jgi:hypothetical protein
MPYGYSWENIMDVIGVDFTSSPRRRKPITVARCTLANAVLTLDRFEDLYDFSAFEDLLGEQGEWIAGLDLPFGQSRQLIENIGWPHSWAKYIALIDDLSREEFVGVLTHYKKERPYGDREHRRACDELAKSISPQKLFGVPVGKMFYEGAKRILRSPANIPLLRPNGEKRTIIEAYPALVARRIIDRTSYKNDTKKKQTVDQHRARWLIIDFLKSDSLTQAYGVRVHLSDAECNLCASDPTADRLDALLCAVQAAWASHRSDHGIPADADSLEGWICDPMLLGEHPRA